MAEAEGSILFVDCDSLLRSLAAAGGTDAAGGLITRPDAWLAAIESGALISPTGSGRTIDLKRCYAGPALDDEATDALASAGFDIQHHDSDGPAGLRLAIDAMDSLTLAEAGTEFILLSAEPDLTPLVARLKASGHPVAVYADDNTSADCRAAADVVLTAEEFAAFLAGTPAPAKPAPAPSTVDRAHIEAFAREVHGATNIPLFSPKTFAELFRQLADEVAAGGYHFQDTAKNVAERLTAAGRAVTGRQVTFVVKGLALKGHVFSTNDTPQRLAEVFREQARYLIGSAGIALDDEREKLLAAWITAPGGALATFAPAKPQPAKAEARPATEPRAPEPSADKNGKAIAKPAPPRPPTRPKSAALPPKPPPAQPKEAVKRPTSIEIRTAIAARITAAARQKPLRAAEPAPRPKKIEEADLPPPREAPSALESSILAAIAEAVDVLVEDGSVSEFDESEAAAPEPKKRPRADREEPAPEDAPPPEAEAAPAAEAEDDGGDDIGDEIQRIVASYNRTRPRRRQGLNPALAVSRWRDIARHWRTSPRR